MFSRPDWRRTEQYVALLGTYQEECLAWEFLRRNPDYQRDAHAYDAEALAWYSLSPVRYDLSDSSCEGQVTNDLNLARTAFFGLNGARHAELLDQFAKKWGVAWPWPPEGDYAGEIMFFYEARESPEAFELVDEFGTGMEGPRVLIPVDLSDPLEILQKKIMGTVKQLRKIGIERGVVAPRTNRVLASRVYVEYLRILDAVEEGATLHEIGEELQPLAVNVPEARQRDKRIRAALAAAKKMQEGGYRVLLNDT